MPTVSIFSRYVFRQVAGALLLILLSLSGIVWIALALRELNVVTSQGQSALTLFKMTTLALPNLMAIIAPVALLIASIHTLNRLNGDSELIVLTASGATVWTVMWPFVTLALIVMAALSVANHLAMPWSLRELRAAVMQVRTDLLTQVIQPGRFSSPEAGLTFHIRERTVDGELLGLIMDDARDPKQIQSYLAERGVIVKQDDTAYLIMTKGHVLRRSEPKEPAQILAFEKYAVDLDRFEPKDNDVVELKPRERFYSELVDPERGGLSARKARALKSSPGQYIAELHERFANPLYPLAFVMIALAFVGQAQSTRQNRGERMAGAFLTAIACRLAGLATNNLVVLKPALAPALYAIPLLTIGAATAWIALARAPKGGPTLVEQTLARLAPLARYLPAWLGGTAPPPARS